MTTLTLRRRRGHRGLQEGRPARQEHVRARPAVLDVRPGDRVAARASSGRSSPASPMSPRPTCWRCKAGWNYGETTEAFGTTLRDRPCRSCRPANTGRFPATPRCHTGSSSPASLPTPRWSSAATRSPRRRTSCTSCPSTRTSTSSRSRPRTRSPASAPRSARRIGGALGVTATSGPGISLKSEAIGLAVMTELPLIVIDVQRGGPSTGLPTKTEQADLLQAHVRPQRRVTGRCPGRRGRRRTASRSARGRAHRADVPDAGDPAVRRRPRERLRAVAHPGHRAPSSRLRPQPCAAGR